MKRLTMLRILTAALVLPIALAIAGALWAPLPVSAKKMPMGPGAEADVKDPEGQKDAPWARARIHYRVHGYAIHGPITVRKVDGNRLVIIDEPKDMVINLAGMDVTVKTLDQGEKGLADLKKNEVIYVCKNAKKKSAVILSLGVPEVDENA